MRSRGQHRIYGVGDRSLIPHRRGGRRRATGKLAAPRDYGLVYDSRGRPTCLEPGYPRPGEGEKVTVNLFLCSSSSSTFLGGESA